MLALVAALALQAAPANTEAICPLESLSADIHACDTAIAAAADGPVKAESFYNRAYAQNEASHFADALTDLDRALAIEPANPKFLHERGYTLGALGEYARAVADLDREVAIRPDSPAAYQERAYSRRRMGDFAGAYSDWGKALGLKPGDMDLLLGRSEAALWTGRFDEARRDALAALALASTMANKAAMARAAYLQHAIDLWSRRSATNDPAARCKDAMKQAKVEAPDLIGDCSAAFLAAASPEDKAGLLTVRSLGWRVGQKDRDSWLEDAEMAVVIDPANGDWHTNLGGVYADLGRPHEALREFDRAVSIKQSFVALAGRSGVKYDLGDRSGAFADAKRSFEIKPNELALTVLGDLDHDRKDDRSAKLYWMGAYHLGDRDDRLIARLKSIGIDHPEQEPRK
jgi:tetratricopeptide (TPR) repeat protein